MENIFEADREWSDNRNFWKEFIRQSTAETFRAKTAGQASQAFYAEGASVEEIISKLSDQSKRIRSDKIFQMPKLPEGYLLELIAFENFEPLQCFQKDEDEYHCRKFLVSPFLFELYQRFPACFWAIISDVKRYRDLYQQKRFKTIFFHLALIASKTHVRR